MKKIIKYDYHRFSVAPMLNYTDQYCRFFYRQMTKNTLLYTEMISTSAILYNKNKIINNLSIENPIAIQIAGNVPSDLAKCAKIAYNLGYNEINLNVGCPSQKIQNIGCGISLMNEIPLLKKCIHAIYNSVPIPISIKTRIGINNINNYNFINNFIEQISYNNLCKIFIVHARSAWLSGINVKKNRNLPELKYEWVYKLKKNFPNLKIIINGGIKTIKEIKNHLSYVDGVMIGRAIYKNPAMLMKIDQEIFKCNNNNYNIIQSITNVLPHIERNMKKGILNKNVFRHISGAFYNLPGSKVWRNTLNKFKSDKKIIQKIKNTLQLIAY